MSWSTLVNGRHWQGWWWLSHGQLVHPTPAFQIAPLSCGSPVLPSASSAARRLSTTPHPNRCDYRESHFFFSYLYPNVCASSVMMAVGYMLTRRITTLDPIPIKTTCPFIVITGNALADTAGTGCDHKRNHPRSFCQGKKSKRTACCYPKLSVLGRFLAHQCATSDQVTLTGLLPAPSPSYPPLRIIKGCFLTSTYFLPRVWPLYLSRQVVPSLSRISVIALPREHLS